MPTPRSSTLRCARFATHLLRLLSGALPAGVAACSSSSDTSDAEGVDSCATDVPPASAVQPDLDRAAFVCAPPGADGTCGAAEDEPTKERVRSALSATAFTGCSCTCQVGLDAITCVRGDDGNGSCCYEVVIDVQDHCGKGRDFLVDGELRTADAMRRDDWSGLGPIPPSPLPAGVRDALAAAWTRDALLEHAAVAAFARFTLELMAVGAPAAVVHAAQVAAADEVRHAEQCFALASRFAGAPVGPGALDVGGRLEVHDSLAEIAAASVIEGCIGETISAFRALAARDVATDAGVRATLAGIGRDEITHAELAWRFVAWAVARGGPEVSRAVDDAFARGVEMAAATRVALCARAGASAPSPELEAHGRLSAQLDVEVRDAVWRDVLMPARRALQPLPPTPSGLRLSRRGCIQRAP